MKLIPVFTYPAYLWANSVKIIFNSGEINLNDRDTNLKFAPQILTSLPQALLSVLPDDKSVQSVLDFLLQYDSPRLNLNSVVEGLNGSQKPSLKYYQVVEQTKTTLSSGSASDVVREVAWSLVLSSLPSQLKMLAVVLKVEKFPTHADLLALDNAFADMQNDSVSVVQPAPTQSPDISTPNTDLNSSVPLWRQPHHGSNKFSSRPNHYPPARHNHLYQPPHVHSRSRNNYAYPPYNSSRRYDSYYHYPQSFSGIRTIRRPPFYSRPPSYPRYPDYYGPPSEFPSHPWSINAVSGIQHIRRPHYTSRPPVYRPKHSSNFHLRKQLHILTTKIHTLEEQLSQLHSRDLPTPPIEHDLIPCTPLVSAPALNIDTASPTVISTVFATQVDDDAPMFYDAIDTPEPIHPPSLQEKEAQIPTPQLETTPPCSKVPNSSKVGPATLPPRINYLPYKHVIVQKPPSDNPADDIFAPYYDGPFDILNYVHPHVTIHRNGIDESVNLASTKPWPARYC